MPELPEVECVRQRLAEGLRGHQIKSVLVRRPDYIRFQGQRCGPVHVGSGPKSKNLLDALLAGTSKLQLLRHGKQLALWATDRPALALHLGMSGQLLWRDDGPPGSHTHITWTLDHGRHLDFRDPRRFGGVWCFASLEDLQQQRWTPLGPDALTISDALLRSQLAKTTRAVKAALLDQAVLAGVGNIYADEALFAAGLHPLRKARAIKAPAVAALAHAIRETLANAILAGGSTLRDYRTPDGSPGRYAQQHAVYGRADQPCRRCGESLRGIQVAQRATVFCPQCQRYRRTK